MIKNVVLVSGVQQSDSVIHIHVSILFKEVSQRKTNIILYHLYVKSKKMIQMNLFTKHKQTHRIFWIDEI